MMPSYNHTPSDSAKTPCVLCASADREAITKRLEALALELGTTNQRDRYARGLLPEVELTALARAELFDPLVDMKRWPMIRTSQVRHDHDCKAHLLPDLTPVTKFESHEGAQLDHEEFDTLRAIEAIAEKIRIHPWLAASAGQVSVEIYTHTARCTLCAGPVVTKHSAMVRVNWAWRVLSREYLL